MDVSIVVTAYNYARYLPECLNSCLDQQGTRLMYEVIVVDDGSTDDTPALLASYSDRRLHINRIENSGIELASNHGFEAASGRYVVRVDADDILDRFYLARIEPVLQQGIGFCYSDYIIIDENSAAKEVVRLPNFDETEVINRGDFLATGTIYTAELLHRLGGYSSQTRNSGLENYELIIKLMAMGVKGIHVAEPLFKYRHHCNNMSTKRVSSIISYGQAMFERYGLGAFRTNQYHPYKLILPELQS